MPRQISLTPASVARHQPDTEYIIVHKRVRKHWFLCSRTLIAGWDGNPTRPEKYQAQDTHTTVKHGS